MAQAEGDGFRSVLSQMAADGNPHILIEVTGDTGQKWKDGEPYSFRLSGSQVTMPILIMILEEVLTGLKDHNEGIGVQP